MADEGAEGAVGDPHEAARVDRGERDRRVLEHLPGGAEQRLGRTGQRRAGAGGAGEALRGVQPAPAGRVDPEHAAERPQLVEEGGHVAVPVLGTLGGCAGDDEIGPVLERAVEPGGRRRQRFVQVLLEDQLVGALERQLADQALPEQNAERVDVALV